MLAKKQKIEIEMVQIPSGKFSMGSNHNKSEQPIHKVILQTFYMSKYLITQEQYELVMGYNPSYFRGQNLLPVESVSWYNAQDFCQKLSEMTGKQYRLPSEAEWEYACRAGSETRYYFGDDDTQLSDYAWYGDNSGKSQLDTLKLLKTEENNYSSILSTNNCQTHVIGEKKPNDWGLYDMHGNVWEWCEDDWHNNYHNAPQDRIPWCENQIHEKASTFKVLRGGSWLNSSLDCCSTYRLYNLPKFRRTTIGIRLVCD